jgi:hypothetical protein
VLGTSDCFHIPFHTNSKPFDLQADTRRELISWTRAKDFLDRIGHRAASFCDVSLSPPAPKGCSRQSA